MRKLVLALAALLCLPGIGFAKSAKLTQEDNVATLEFPDSCVDLLIRRFRALDIGYFPKRKPTRKTLAV